MIRSVGERASRPSRQDSAMRPAAYAIESVAEPFPALASTTSVPAFWIRSVNASASADVKVTFGVTYTVFRITRTLAHDAKTW